MGTGLGQTEAEGGERLMPWKKGESGNPKGRPKILPGIRAQARVDSPKAYQALAEVMRDKKHKHRVSAAVQILRIAGVSFASEAEEATAQAEARRVATPAEIAAALGHPAVPLN